MLYFSLFIYLFLLFKDAETTQNIKKGLEIMRVVSVKYSSPNSVSGRFPGFTRAILSKNFPGFAYYAATAPNLNMDGSLGEIAAIDSENIKPFLRLFDTGYNVFSTSFRHCFLCTMINSRISCLANRISLTFNSAKMKLKNSKHCRR